MALARSLAPEPELLLLDEPLSALDRELREELVITLRNLIRSLQLTVVYVTHDQDELQLFSWGIVLSLALRPPRSLG